MGRASVRCRFRFVMNSALQQSYIVSVSSCHAWHEGMMWCLAHSERLYQRYACSCTTEGLSKFSSYPRRSAPVTCQGMLLGLTKSQPVACMLLRLVRRINRSGQIFLKDLSPVTAAFEWLFAWVLGGFALIRGFFFLAHAYSASCTHN